MICFTKKAFFLISLLLLSSCGFMTKKEYTVIREKARAVPDRRENGQFLVPVYDVNGQFIQQGKLVQKNGIPAYVTTDINSNNGAPLYVSPVSGKVLSDLEQKEGGVDVIPNQPLNVLPLSQASTVSVLPQENVKQLYQKEEVASDVFTYQGQKFPLSVNEVSPPAQPTQGQIQREMGMPQTPMQANIVQSYANCPYIVVLQHPEERNLVKCLMCDQVCLQRYEHAGYVQLRYIPHSSGSQDLPSMSDYPAGRWRENEEIPRW